MGIKTKSALKLNKETLRTLAAEQLELAAGGSVQRPTHPPEASTLVVLNCVGGHSEAPGCASYSCQDK